MRSNLLAITNPAGGDVGSLTRRLIAFGLISFVAFHAACQQQLESMEAQVHRAGRAKTEASNASVTKTGDAETPEEVPVPQLPTDILTIEYARELAIHANPDVHAARARVVTAAARAEEVAALYWPSVDFTHNSARTFQTPASRNRLASALSPSISLPTDIDSTNLAITTLLNALRRPLFGVSNPGGDSNSFSEHRSSFTATWAALDFTRDAQYDSAKHVQLASEHSLDDVERVIVRAVDAAYYRVQLAEEQIRISQADLEFSNEQTNEAEKLLKAGRASATDVSNFKIRALTAETDLSAAGGVREMGRAVLAELMGVSGADLPQDLKLAALEDETTKDLELPSVEEWVNRSLANRPDIKQLDELVQSAEHNVAAAKALYSPTVAVSGSYGFDHSGNLEYSKEDQSSALAIELQWELFTGGARAARVRAAEGNRTESVAQLNRLKLAVQADVRSAISLLSDTQRRIVLQRETLATAEESRRIVRAAYIAGREPLTRLNEAQRDYLTADAGLALARIRLRQAWSDLYASAGETLVTVNNAPANSQK